MPTLQAKDLTREFPRSPFDELGGFPWLPRLIDKVRALKAGTLGDYTPFPCGGDQGFLGTIGLDAEALKAVIAGGASDDEVLQWVKANVPADVEARIAAYKQRMVSPYEPPISDYLAAAKDEFKKAHPDVDLSGVVNFSQLICLEEGYPIPKA